jgi:signal transduction histidine kinase
VVDSSASFPLRGGLAPRVDAATRRRALAAAVCLLALALVAVTLALTPAAARVPLGGQTVLVLTLVAAWGLASVGAFAWLRHPDNRTGLLMVAVGFLVLFDTVVIADAPLLRLRPLLVDTLVLAVLAHLLFAFPSGRLGTMGARVVVGGLYLTATIVQLPIMLFGEGAVKLLGRHDALVDVAQAVRGVAALGLAVVAVGVLVRNWRSATLAQRRGLAPVLVLGMAILASLVVSIVSQAALDRGTQDTAQIVFAAAFAALPAAFLVGLLRSRFLRTAAVSRLIDQLMLDSGTASLDRTLASALGDPSLRVAYWFPERRGYVDRRGAALDVPPADGRVVTDIVLQGRRVGALLHDPSMCDDPELVQAAAGAAALALENGRLEVLAREELRARADEQAALRRVATLVARQQPEQELFAVVSEEVGRLLAADAATLLRFVDDEHAVVLGSWSGRGAERLPVGTAVTIHPRGVLAEIRDTGSPARVGSDADAVGDFAGLIQSRGLHSSVAAPITLGEQLWGTVVASMVEAAAMPQQTEQRLGHFAELVSQALANSAAQRQLRASRTRIVEAGDAERRRLGRDLHDGAQQRLVSLLLEVQLAREHVESDPQLSRELLDQALSTAQAAVDEMRELAAGIHPAILAQRGLDAALESLASRSPVHVERDVAFTQRLPLPVETAAYFVVAEALTNVAKYARATSARVSLRRTGDDLVVEIRDDGIGGADPDRGTGLRGLADRVGAVDGTLTLESAPGAGTTVAARIPVRG